MLRSIPSRSSASFLLAAASLLTVAGCASHAASDDGAVDADLEELATTGVKAELKGLVWTSGAFPSGSQYAFVKSRVLKIDWAQLEPSDGHFDWSAIDAAVADAHARGAALRLRILAGDGAPQFVKAIDGYTMSDATHGIDCSKGGIAVYNKYDGVGGCVPPFWHTRVLDQYEQLVAALAARYDGTPEIRDVVDSACMTTYAEPFYRAHAESGSNLRLWNAGLDFTKDRACHTRAVQIHAKYLVHTRTSLAINAWDVIDGSTDHWTPSTQDTLDFVTQVAEPTLGRRLVLQNNSLGESDGCPSGGGALTAFPFCFISAYTAGGKGFQTETFARLGTDFSSRESGLWSALDSALAMGSNFVEFSGMSLSDFDQLPVTKLQSFDTALRQDP